MVEFFGSIGWVWALVVFVGELFAVFTIFNIILKVRSAAGAWGWGMAVVAFPFVAVPLYWIFGRRQFRGYMEEFAAVRERHAEVFDDFEKTISPFFVMPEKDTELHRYGRILTSLSERSFTRRNSVCLLEDGQDTFDSILEAMAGARQYILIQFFIYHDDGIGNRIADLMKQKADEGVSVYFIYDEIGSHKLPRKFISDLRERGVKAFPFHSTQGPSNRFQINFRNHRKIVVVDGEVGFLGGHNVGDEYLGLSPRFGPWRDTHIRLVGPSVLSLQMVFLSDYVWASKVIPELDWTHVAGEENSPCGEQNATVMTLPNGPVGDIEGGTMMFLNAITEANDRFWIASPYFVTDESVRSALLLAALRGVDVRILLPQKPDKWVPWLATFSFLPDLLAAGIRVYRYQEGFLHQKTFVVDDVYGAVGTANLDNRSMRLNFEVTGIVFCPRFTEQLSAMFERDFARSREVVEHEPYERKLFFRIGVRLARLFSPIL